MAIRVPVELNDNAVSHYVVLSASSIGIWATSIIIHSAVYGAQGLCYFTDNLQGSV
jgi:hypothetical protein